ncbi:hypothetical protein [Gandjariella thermophila]|uniref:Uncharacterized protein n=1 Tax=Gandjariella thermophila TaxID=1931992 RepID=A0A4D4JBB9_9PSEU|nr:hypothetical protein [Gandjariella thermophila]GDY31133.1 hypothetical protein GTS_27660 [Gandjariella thermophila]
MTGQSVPTRGGPRVLRGGLLALTAGALAVTAHGLAGGGWPDSGFTLLLTALLAAAGTALAGRRRGLPAILGALGASQVALHLLLTDLDPHPDAGAGGMAADWRVMTAAHTVAVLLTALLLTRAEAAVFAVAAAIAALLPRRMAPGPVNAGPRQRVIPAVRAGTELRVLFRRVCARRGPPAHS